MLIDTLENSYSYLCQGSETLSILINYYKLYRHLQEEMAIKLSDLSYELECSELVKSLSSTLTSFSMFLKQSSNRYLEMSK